jgi:glycogen operon protein
MRARQQRNFIATLLLSQGVPMLLGGDEFGRSQQGNNNAYCQDNPLSWVDWQFDEARASLLAFTQQVMALRAAHPVFRRRDFFQGRPLRGSEVRDIVWLHPDGHEMSDQAWGQDHARALAVLLSGEGLNDVDARGRPLRDDNFLLLFNADPDEVSFSLPNELNLGEGELLIDTRSAKVAAVAFDPGLPYVLRGRSLALVRFLPPAAP